MSFILSLDQGTSSSRAIVFDEAGTVVVSAQREFKQYFPQSGWVEHDAEEIWETQLGVAVEALESAGLAASSIAAIGITNQRETTVVWDRFSGKPIAPAIVWQDRRTAGFCDELRERGLEPVIQEKTGLVVDSYFSGTKLRWLLEHVPGARKRAERGELAFGTIDSWLVWNLTGGKCHVTDPSNASRTQLYNLKEETWDVELLRIFDIPAEILPEIRPSSGFFRDTNIDNFSAPIPIMGIGGDQQAALFGQCCFDPGMIKCTYGTGCFILLNTGRKIAISDNNLLTTAAWDLGDGLNYAQEGSVFMGGAVVQWLRDGLGIIENSEDVETLATSVKDSGGIFLVPAFTGLGAPYWDPYARGAMVGMTRDTNKAHIARAALEGIAFQVAEVVSAMKADSNIELKELRVDGGASKNDLLMQIQADLLGIPVARAKTTEATALGVAYLAGLGAQIWRSTNEIAPQWEREKTFEPTISQDEREELMANWARAVERSRGWAKSQ